MELLVSHVILSIVVGAICLRAGWWLRGRLPDRQSLTGQPDEALLRDLTARLHGLSICMAANVDEHSTEVGAVDRELAQASNRNAAKIGELVDRLIQANQSVQSKLSETEGKLEKLSQKIEHHATEARTDVLTGLANRRAFGEEVARCQANFRNSDLGFSLLMIDIDRFKQVNDVHGHPFGDEVLRGVGAILRDNMRVRDIVTRYGGEEFAILMPGTDLADARRAAESLREFIEKTRFEFGGKSLSLTVSLGVAEIQPFEDVPELLKRADQAMYAAKNAGRNRAYWHDGTLPHPIRTPGHREADVSHSMAVSQNQSDSSEKLAVPTAEGVPTTTESRRSAAGTAPIESGDSCVRSSDIDMNVLNNMGNKTIFCQSVHRRIAEFNRGGSPFSVVLLRADGCDEITRDHGESAAEIVLGVVAEAIRKRLREMDLVARYNDLTFGMVLPDATLRNAICVGERLRKAIKETTIAVNGKSLRFTISLGIVEVADGDEMATLVERARAQLEQAQESGGNRTGFSARELVAS